ncbi:MAG: phage portal protein [Pseudomonadota bacterium]
MTHNPPQIQLPPSMTFSAAKADMDINAARQRLNNIKNFETAYKGASHSRRGLSGWNASSGSANRDLEHDRRTLTQRSRDAYRNDALAGAAIDRSAQNVVGPGIRPMPDINHKALGITEEAAQDMKDDVMGEFAAFAESYEFDCERRLSFPMMQYVAFISSLMSGDTFVHAESFDRSGSTCRRKFRLIEADRVCNPHGLPDTDKLVGGVESDGHGAPLYYHVLNVHPGDYSYYKAPRWERVRAFGPLTGRRLMLHITGPLTRPGQARGVPFIAPVMEELKQFGRYTDSELMRAVVQSYYTAFVETAEGSFPQLTNEERQVMASEGLSEDDLRADRYNNDPSFHLDYGTIAMLQAGDRIKFPQTTAPNSVFGQFQQHIATSLGARLGIPVEVLLMSFNGSYSAARAAMLESWRLFILQREWFNRQFNQPVYELFWDELVASGRVDAPGYSDPRLQRVYQHCLWVGPPRGQIDEGKEVKAASDRIKFGLSTLEEETIKLTGGDWRANQAQIKREQAGRPVEESLKGE